ncbi:hypothetical protein BC941DRAFT_421966 [Chlamydoabsidia padenii]|nr:hypothetical protein BC941DRAFT_421966 [Chlamydoabsidia padenii]
MASKFTSNKSFKNLKHSKYNSKDSADAKRWLIIGAHQAGASEKRVARIAGLSRTAVRHIILNYQRTGNPCLPKQEPKKVKERLLVEYDEDGNLIVSDDEEDNDDDEGDDDTSTTSSTKKLSDQTRRSSKLNSKVTAKDLIEFMMEQVKRMEREETPIPKSYSLHYDCHSDTNHSSDSFILLSPPSSSGKSLSTQYPSSCGKYDQTIRGYEQWTQNDDLVLLQHVLSRLQLGNWRELEIKFQGRHTARLCNARWNYLRTHLLKGIDQADPSLW